MKKFQYYSYNIAINAIPKFLYRKLVDRDFDELYRQHQNDIDYRVAYYNRMVQPFSFAPSLIKHATGNLKRDCGSAYFLDMLRVMRRFPDGLFLHYIGGDVINVPTCPAFVKSRPIHGDNQNAVLLKLNAIRHFQFIDDPVPFVQKRDSMVWRGRCFNDKRRQLLQRFYTHPTIDVGDTRPANDTDQAYRKAPLTPQAQLQHKFILSVEGKDVATNLKWIMSSNSLCVSPPMEYETWFMEGRLIPGVHYAEVNADFSNLEEVMDYYLTHPHEAEAIINNAHQWVNQFRDRQKEAVISYLVAEKYFRISQQR
ncbi:MULTISPECIES: glycosyl transferase family 90 [unclassified Salinivibrio]|uniref:glycosyl transferase family 90 n=1 Tax=unclassified Salinivibrio TaxID=2636825 RepID=UPI0012C65A53|nr:lipopolysaccharide A protein [Salinivibrio sp. VYel7]MPX90993.1 lipopolysaccharide A protein [Salinivibrio sp. VYel1]MPX94236.1 lipopolysaccharide A protein [Salinivibrio sp. VYel9]MPX97300.1 lipopolysaccharide A protein [Salinivibrio sp. VYel6]MPY00522.1 lipopolysaccharide A protein [Salinivibrio sp. VYel4]MPY03475.1 lipopolysaccharide A protein [Salinivibrio sp. VYel5]MPY06455.1 lipopolysaccharide A protein [Salinivibrio sp. VYel8]MPY14369.1 lipopolysaccharide A protein [Salinivibrio sp